MNPAEADLFLTNASIVDENIYTAEWVIKATRSDFCWVTKCAGACRNTEALLGSLRQLLAAYT